MQPVLDLVARHTGMVLSLLMGGPEPAAGGRLNIIGCVLPYSLSLAFLTSSLVSILEALKAQYNLGSLRRSLSVIRTK